jgi:hypothetical protein
MLIEAGMGLNPVDYYPTPYDRYVSGNSNSWCRELLEQAGLLDEFEHAMTKRWKAWQIRPWAPGWGLDYWRGPFSFWGK